MSETYILQSKEIHSRMNYLRNQPIINALLSMIYCMTNQFDKSYEYLQSASNLHRAKEFSSFIAITGTIYYITTHNLEQTKLSCHKLTAMLNEMPIDELVRALPIYGFMANQKGDKQRVVELLGLSFNHPAMLKGWMYKWDTLTQLRASLKNELGEEAYNRAWEGGKSLDLETVVKELLTEFGDRE